MIVNQFLSFVIQFMSEIHPYTYPYIEKSDRKSRILSFENEILTFKSEIHMFVTEIKNLVLGIEIKKQ